MDENYYRRRFLMEFFNIYDFYKKTSDEEFKKIMQHYIDTGEVLDLQDYIGMYLDSFHTWMTNIGLIDAMDAVIQSVKEEGRLNI